MSKKPTHKASLMYDATDKEWNFIKKFHEICPIWETEKGTLFIDVPTGMSISWTIVVTKNKDKEDEDELF